MSHKQKHSSNCSKNDDLQKIIKDNLHCFKDELIEIVSQKQFSIPKNLALKKKQLQEKDQIFY